MHSSAFRTFAPLFATTFTLLSACSAAQPSPVVASPQHRAVDAPSPSSDASCAAPPPLWDQECPAGDDACSEAQRDGAKAWHAWTLRCAPVSPRDPIAGETVQANVPYPPGGQGICTAGNLTVEKVEQNDITVLRVKNETRGQCDDLLSFSGLDLGTLPAGRYRIDTGYWSNEFVVRPAGSDPGELPETTRLAAEVALVDAPGQCFGMPGPSVDGASKGDFDRRRVGRQMKKAFPDRSYQELERLYASAGHVTVTPDGPDSWRYAYRDGACCTISDVEGTLTRDAAGKVLVGPARVVSSESVPC